MCGIVGAFAIRTLRPIAETPIHEALRRMARRGPDDSGTFFANGIALGHRRLAILDPAAGRQPWIDPATGCVLVYNGEIYNFRELRDQLAAQGHSFSTHCDTEVLMQAYLAWGTRCLDPLVGMYAFALYDPRDRRLLLARDRMGVKPLYYAEANATLFFASSMAALLAMPEIEPRLDPEAAVHYLTTARTTFGARTLIRDIRTLQPGDYLDVRNTTPAAQTYWTLPAIAAADKVAPPLATAIAQTRHLTEEAVRSQLISDVPLGGFLSGGLDSSVIAALAGRFTGGRYDAYSVGYNMEGYHEWPFVREAAAFHRMQCREVHLDVADWRSDAEFLVREKGLPLSTPNEVALYRLARSLRETFTVALSGEGADEVFGGYTLPYFSAHDFDRAGQTPHDHPDRPALDSALRRLYGRNAFTDLTEHFFLINSWIPANRLPTLLAPDAGIITGRDGAVWNHYTDLLNRFAHCTTFDRYLHVHARVNLEGLLSRVDSSTMAASVEGRVPYTDHRLAEHLFALPDTYKIAWRDGTVPTPAMNAHELDQAGVLEAKRLLRRAFAPDVPASILNRPKMSFPTPFREWFAGPLRPMVEEATAHSPLCGTFFDANALRRMVATAGLPATALMAWPVVNLNLWATLWNIRPE
jgi:asparagine synthase (glutamine-hydrolysing)